MTIKVKYIEDDEYKALYSMSKEELIDIIKDCDEAIKVAKKGNK
ncbi:hypothetical protein [Sharpea azabuensis]